MRGADDFGMRIQDDAGNIVMEEEEEDTVPSVIVSVVSYSMVLLLSYYSLNSTR